MGSLKSVVNCWQYVQVHKYNVWLSLFQCICHEFEECEKKSMSLTVSFNMMRSVWLQKLFCFKIF